MFTHVHTCLKNPLKPQIFYATGFVWVFLDCEVIIIICTLQAVAEMQTLVGGVTAIIIQIELTAGFIWRPGRDRSEWKRE